MAKRKIRASESVWDQKKPYTNLFAKGFWQVYVSFSEAPGASEDQTELAPAC